MNASNFLENAFLDHVLRVSVYTQPTSLFIALFDNNSSDAALEQGTLTGELVGNGYARKLLSTEFSTAAANGTITNDADIIFDSATGDWSDVVRSALLDQAGNVLIYGSLASPVPVSNGDTFQFNATNWTANAD